jgi:transcription initiation factor TFIIB
MNHFSNEKCVDNCNETDTSTPPILQMTPVQSRKREKKTTKPVHTLKKKIHYTTDEKKRIWNLFDEERNNVTQDPQEEPIISVIPDRPSKFRKMFAENKSHIDSSHTVTEIHADEDFEDKTKTNDICNICKYTLIITEDGFPTCTNTSCGIIYKDTLDYSPEWRFYGADDKNNNDMTRCGNPINPLLFESSFGCKIICNNHSSYEMKKMRKWTEWQSMPHKEKSLYEEFQFITTMAQNSGIPKIFIDDAIAIHKDISEQKMFRGLNRDGIKASSIYLSCRLNGCPRTPHEISEIFFLDKVSATAGCSTAVNILHNIERNLDPSFQTNLGSTTPSSFIERYCSKLQINKELTILSKFVVGKVEKNELITDNTPHAIAAGVIFFVSKNCNLNISKLDVKKICGISEVTINKCFKKLNTMKEQLLPKCVVNKYNGV